MQRLELNDGVVILDTETTGLQVDSAEICEIAIIDYDGNQIFNSLVKLLFTYVWVFYSHVANKIYDPLIPVVLSYVMRAFGLNY